MRTITIQVHPNDENRMMDVFSQANWRVISNQRCQEEHSEIENGETVYYTYTFNKITMQREEDISIYDERRLAELIENYYKSLHDWKSDADLPKAPTIESVKPRMPSKPSLVGSFIVCFIFAALAIFDIIGIVTSLIANSTGNASLYFMGDSLGDSMPFLLFLSPSIVLFIVWIVKIIKTKKSYKYSCERYVIELEKYNSNPEKYLEPFMEEYNNTISKNNELSQVIDEQSTKIKNESIKLYGHELNNMVHYDDYIEKLSKI